MQGKKMTTFWLVTKGRGRQEEKEINSSLVSFK